MTKKVVLLVLVVLALSAQTGLVVPTTLADITGDAAAHKVASSGTARWVQFIAASGNAAVVRVGDSNVSTTRGLPIAAGAGQMFPMLNGDQRSSVNQQYYDLSTIYYVAAIGDKVSIVWVK